MKAPVISQPIEFWGVKVPVPDGLGGFTGEAERLHRQLGEVKPLPSKRDDTGSAQTIKQQYAIVFWNNPAYAPQQGHSVRWKDQMLTIQNVDYVDATRLKYRLIALAQ
ncbi:phage head completion protein [Fibrella forsythiae]|uniref:Head-tail adaptor protein n=1 Tax=Fibrella forsythiae TaxID=2817061 RepID=A0ABS3JC05_9BACT|nr:hypothetical protein [Fibrella forsythiae]MBO0947525.1 hypothetical protein [Fibrella forsythiae]